MSLTISFKADYTQALRDLSYIDRHLVPRATVKTLNKMNSRAKRPRRAAFRQKFAKHYAKLTGITRESAIKRVVIPRGFHATTRRLKTGGLTLTLSVPRTVPMNPGEFVATMPTNDYTGVFIRRRYPETKRIGKGARGKPRRRLALQIDAQEMSAEMERELAARRALDELKEEFPKRFAEEVRDLRSNRGGTGGRRR